MSWLDVLLLFLAAMVGGFGYGLAQAWWRDRHPFEIEIRLDEGADPPEAVVTIDRPVSREEHRCLAAAVERGGRMVLDADASWRFGDGPLPERRR